MKRKKAEPPRAKRGSITAHVLVGLTEEQNEVLTREAERAGLSKSELMRVALQTYLVVWKR